MLNPDFGEYGTMVDFKYSIIGEKGVIFYTNYFSDQL